MKAYHVVCDLELLVGCYLEVIEIHLTNEYRFNEIIQVVIEETVVVIINEQETISLAVIISPNLH